MPSDNTDPLDGADIGETETVTVRRRLWVGDLESDACRGSDRIADSEVVDTEIVVNDGEEYLAVTIESDVTKRLPRNWDTCREPRTHSERVAARRRRWRRRAGTAIPLVAAVALSFAITSQVYPAFAATMLVETMPTFWEIAPATAVIVAIATLITLYMSGDPAAPRFGTGRP
ncbi:MAG: hypothetical protein ACOCZD_02500 [Haloferacaceae archaeon]